MQTAVAVHGLLQVVQQGQPAITCGSLAEFHSLVQHSFMQHNQARFPPFCLLHDVSHASQPMKCSEVNHVEEGGHKGQRVVNAQIAACRRVAPCVMAQCTRVAQVTQL